MHFGQIIRVYSENFYTIWDLDLKRRWDCSINLSHGRPLPGLIVSFEIGSSNIIESEIIAIKEKSSGNLTEKQLEEIILPVPSDNT